MSDLIVKPVLIPFNGSEIEAVEHNGEILVGVRKTCNELGIDVKSQMAKIKEDSVLSSTMVLITTVAQDGKNREQSFIKLKGYALWLASIQGSRVKKEVRPLLIQFKLEAADVLEKHFTNRPKSSAEMLLMYAEQFVEQEKRISKMESTVTTIQETFLQRDEDWRKSINSMLNTAAFKLGGSRKYPELRNQSYQLLEERARCKLDTRLSNLIDRLQESGATKTKISKTSRMDVIESDAKLKEIYTTIVKELSIGSLQI